MCEGVGVIVLYLVCGYYVLYDVFECEMVEWLGYLCVLLFGSGFVVNLVV